MAEEYTRKVLKQSVAKMCLTIGWHSSMTTPIEVLTDILGTYLLELGRTTNEYATGFGMTEPNLDHLAMAFRDFHINLPELEDYVQNVDIIEPVAAVPKYPLPKEDHLNFLKPGSKEVVTRPVHIHEHMPPMFPLLEGAEDEPEIETKKEFVEDIVDVENLGYGVKKLVDISPNDPFKRPRLLTEEEGRPTREISSVMMTTSGFLSPAREGKLPESRSPIVPIDPPPAPRPASPADHPPKIVRPPLAPPERRPLEPTKLFPPHAISPMATSKKKSFVKNIVKSKLKPPAHSPVSILNRELGGAANDVKPASSQPHVLNEVNKALAAARLKTEKLNTTITPVVPQIEPPVVIPSSVKVEAQVDKLFTEPDKKKVNIFKKISNVKNDKTESSKMLKEQRSDHTTPAVIEERGAAEFPNKVHHLSSDITIELINAPAAGKGSERMHFDDDSPPGTPSAPRTPEMIAQSPPRPKEKRKRKDKSKVRKMAKAPSPARLEHDSMEVNLDRPKTPEARFMGKDAHDVIPPVVPPIRFPFFSNFAGPGLIPTPLFPHLPLPPMGSFGQPPYLPPVHPGLPHFSHSKPEPLLPVALPEPTTQKAPPQPTIPPTPIVHPEPEVICVKPEKKSKEHKKERKEKEKIKKKNKKDKTEKKKLKEEKKEKVKKEKKEKRKEKDEIQIEIPKLTLKLHPSSPNPEIVEPRKLNIKPIIKKEEEPLPPPAPEPKREVSPELAKISALVTGMPKPKISGSNPVANQISKEELQQAKEEVPTVSDLSPSSRPGAGPGRPRSRPVKPKPTKANKQQTQAKDADGNKVWICPACGKQDDGSPMIGCDDCDAWYHWVCVGIQVPPEDDEDWYCRLCISKKQEVLQGDRKNKRKRKEKKEH